MNIRDASIDSLYNIDKELINDIITHEVPKPIFESVGWYPTTKSEDDTIVVRVSDIIVLKWR